ncbi:MAG TPA: methylmalonyl Co-A mutase-associated GTPase MeaB [Candidatus Binatia bacterium]|nr:methylmalonyl Co-A mutase-associated GTPase MeaB [Candidatus Binatia bacterium]
MDDLLHRVRQGERRAVARAITQIERSEERAREIVVDLYASTGKAHIVGLTGAPGTGKSTLVNHIARALRERDLQVGIIAVDPSSPFSGGALLGDRIRMQDLSGDEGIFIRSMASRGSLGGLARATASVAKVLDAAGFDAILIETVGAGQAEVSIAATAHTTVVVEAPGMGDDIQSIKAGILEIADILVVNKADRPGAAATVKALRQMLQMGKNSKRWQGHRELAAATTNGPTAEVTDGPQWEVRVIETVALDGQGIPELVDAIGAHRNYLERSGQWLQREIHRSYQEIEQILRERLESQLDAGVSKHDRDRLARAVASREVDPYTAASRLFRQLFLER